MSTETTCLCDVCPDCLNAESDGLWICYYDQYRVAINGLLAMDCAKESILPLLNMVSTYIELWVKAIGLNFGLGSDNAVTAEMFTGHKLSQLVEKLRDSIRWEEYKQIEKDLFSAWDIVDYLSGLSAEEDISLSEAMRYPQTRKKSYALNQCLMAHLVELCDKFPVKNILSEIKKLMELTYNIYNQIYEMRVLQNKEF
jgi:hypothetical protein